MRLIVIVLLAAGGVALVLALAAWLAERRMAREAALWSFSDIAAAPAVDVALVLGTAPIGPEGGPNRYYVYRLDAAAALWHAGKAKTLLVSGNRSGDSYDEPAAMQAGLIARGVPVDAIRQDPEGFRTRASVLRARDVYGQSRILIVSQRFHAGRALYIAHHAGIAAWGVDARDVDVPHGLYTALRRYPSALIAIVETWAAAR